MVSGGGQGAAAVFGLAHTGADASFTGRVGFAHSMCYFLVWCIVCFGIVGSCLVSDISLLFAGYVRVFPGLVGLVVRWDFYYSGRPEVWRLVPLCADVS